MTEITVDLDDLEALIYAAVGVKDIEGKLAAFKRDPMMAVQTAKFTTAHDRLNRAVLHAKRSAANGSTRTGWDERLSGSEFRILEELEAVSGMARFIYFTPDQKSVCDGLAAKGCVEMGQAVEGVVWAGAPHPEIIPDVTKFAIRLTPRGQARLEDAKMQVRNSLNPPAAPCDDAAERAEAECKALRGALESVRPHIHTLNWNSEGEYKWLEAQVDAALNPSSANK